MGGMRGPPKDKQILLQRCVNMHVCVISVFVAPVPEFGFTLGYDLHAMERCIGCVACLPHRDCGPG